MSQFVRFKNDAKLKNYIRFSITKGAFKKMSSHERGVKSLLLSLSSRKVLLITTGKQKGYYEVYTDDGCYLCTVSDNRESLLIIGFNKNTLIKQNNALKNGICFTIDDGIIIQLKLGDPYNYFFDITNGVKLKDNRYERYSVSESIKIIEEQIALSYSTGDEEQLMDKEYEPEKPLANLLQIAEQYSILSSEQEELQANSADRVSYYAMRPLDYDRIDRVAYEFQVDHIDVNIYKIGTKVDIEGKEEKRHSGEIISLVSESVTKSIGILFNEHIDIRDFHQAGWITLSFSTVNKDVQLAAIDKIRSGKSAAKYMDKVFGKGESFGFEEKDLEQVQEELSKQQYPPNDSQMNAIHAGICSKDVFLVMGPPGTGKTTVILEWVKYFVKHEHKRVLVSSQNNKAVDNVLARIADEKDIDVIRIGSESKLQSEVIPYMFENKVRSLREYIVKHTKENMEDILVIKKEWDDFSIHMELVVNLNGEVEKHKEATSKISKVLGFIPNYINSLLVDRNIEKLYALKGRKYYLVDYYNKLKVEYEKLYESIKDEEYVAYYNKKLSRDKVVESIYDAIPESTNKWKLFNNIILDKSIWRDHSQFLSAFHSVIDECKRADKLIQAITLWKSETESQQNYALNEIVLESVDLVGATCIGINSQKRFANLDFDVTIIDEAGQIQVHNALVPMSVSNKLIMLGDHKQIPPTVDEELLSLCTENNVDTELLEKSLFEQMYEDLPDDNKIMLDTQYRMPSDIADIISEWFYDSKYLSADFKKNCKSQLPDLSKSPFIIIDTSQEQGRYEFKTPEGGSSNNLEAIIVAELMEKINSNPDISLKDIGIISAYKSQVKLIKEKLAKFLGRDLVNEMVATLDSYQGQERDIIIYSFTKSSNRKSSFKRIGFLRELRRLNVAMSRCKKTLILIGDMKFLSSCENMDLDEDDDPIYEKSEKQFSDFIEKMLRDVKSGRGEYITYEQFKNRISKRGDD